GVAREVAKAAGADVLLAGSARRERDGRYAFVLSAVEPSAGRRLFSVSEVAPARAEVLPAIDRLSTAARRELREGEEDLRKRQIRVAQAVTSSPEAYQAYSDGVDCLERPSASTTWVSFDRACIAHLNRALALDPTFALAHYQIAVLLGVENPADPEMAAHMEAALRYSERVPRKEAGLIQAWKAHLDGQDEKALAVYGTLLSEFPDEKQALWMSGEINVARGQLAMAVPFYEKMLALDPGAEWALDSLVNTLGPLRRHGELRSLLTSLGRSPLTAATSHAVVQGLAWLGDPQGALQAAREGVSRGLGPSAEDDLEGALAVAGEFREIEAILRRRLAADPARLNDASRLAGVLLVQGRRSEALATFEAQIARAEGGRQGDFQFRRAISLADDPDAAARWRQAARAAALAPQYAGTLAIPLALFGDLPHAVELAALLPPGSTEAEEYAALVKWREGDAAGAMARLATLDARDPWPAGFAPAYLLAEVSAAAGDWRSTLSAVERFRSLWPRGRWRSWAIPRSSYLAALAHAELGEGDAARAELDRLFALWRRADPDLPLLREARKLRSRLPR
ncbi:MAG TPA: serine/threonine protein kinase, partial [Anaeromyxobacter sp.]